VRIASEVRDEAVVGRERDVAALGLAV